MHWLTKTILLGAGCVSFMYTWAWLSDHGMLKSAAGTVHLVLLILATIGLGLASFVCAITRGKFQ